MTAVPSAQAQFTADAWTPTFSTPGVHSEASFSVNAFASQGADLFVGGRFERIDAVPAWNVAHLEGATWKPLGGGLRSEEPSFMDGGLHALLAAPDGSLYAAGTFETAYQSDGTTVRVNGVARWTGERWEALGGGLQSLPWFDGGSIEPGVGYALALDPLGRLVVGGIFDEVIQPDGTAIKALSIARWTGSAWESFGGFPSEAVYALATDAAGRLYAGGILGSAENPDGSFVSGSHLFVWDGATWSLVGGGFPYFEFVRSLLPIGDDLYVGGSFRSAFRSNGVEDPVSGVARWDGEQWHPLGSGLQGDGAYALAALADGSIAVTGDFSAVLQSDGTALPAEGFARWTGDTWTAPGSFSTGPFTPTRRGRTLLVDADQSVLVGGTFVGVKHENGSVLPTLGLARRRAGGWETVPAGRPARGVTGLVSALAEGSCGRLLVTGQFQTAGEVAAPGVASWDGSTWSAFGTAPQGAALAPAGCLDGAETFYLAHHPNLIVQPDGSLLAAHGVSYWNGTAWEALRGEVGGGLVNDIVVDGDDVYVGGSFSKVYDLDGETFIPLPYKGVARWRRDAGWLPVGLGVGGSVHALALAPDGSLIVGGDFDEVFQSDGTSLAASHVARWTGAQWETFGGPVRSPVAYGAPVTALAVAPDGALIVGGSFEVVRQPGGAELQASHIARWDGHTWSPLGMGLTSGYGVRDLTVDSQGRIFAAVANLVSFLPPTSVGTVDVWDGTTWTRLGSGLYGGDAYALLIDGAGDLVVGGAFGAAGRTPTPFLATYDIAQALTTQPSGGAEATFLTASPNPFRGLSILGFSLGVSGPVRLVVYDALGREVARPVDSSLPAGPHDVRFDASGLPSGLYLVRLATEDGAVTTAVTVVR